MTFALRFANTNTARTFPLDVVGGINWQGKPGRLRARITLPDLDAGTILVPSFSACGRDDYRFRFTLDTAENSYPLGEVPSAKPEGNTQPEDQSTGNEPPVSMHIDCFHIHEYIQSATLTLETNGLLDSIPYLLSVSSRPIENKSVALPERAAYAPQPLSLSQMQASKKIRHAICSPTCLAMLLQQTNKSLDWLKFVQTCRDEKTSMYGVWPLGIWAASRHGCLGSVEVFDDWQNVTHLLDQGSSFVASIRFSEGSLPGAPMKASAGHLVVVYGVDEHNVQVLDPAAPTVAEVARTYCAAAFSRAWLQHRGAAYILLP